MQRQSVPPRIATGVTFRSRQMVRCLPAADRRPVDEYTKVEHGLEARLSSVTGNRAARGLVDGGWATV